MESSFLPWELVQNDQHHEWVSGPGLSDHFNIGHQNPVIEFIKLHYIARIKMGKLQCM